MAKHAKPPRWRDWLSVLYCALIADPFVAFGGLYRSDKPGLTSWLGAGCQSAGFRLHNCRISRWLDMDGAGIWDFDADDRRVDVDDQAQCTYITLRKGKQVRTIELLENEILADLDAYGNVLGIELMFTPTPAWPVSTPWNFTTNATSANTYTFTSQ